MNAARTAPRVAFLRIPSRAEKQRVMLRAVSAAPIAMKARPAIGCIQSVPERLTSQPDCGLMISVQASKSFAPRTRQNIPKMEIGFRVDWGASSCFSSEFMAFRFIGSGRGFNQSIWETKAKLCGGKSVILPTDSKDSQRTTKKEGTF